MCNSFERDISLTCPLLDVCTVFPFSDVPELLYRIIPRYEWPPRLKRALIRLKVQWVVSETTAPMIKKHIDLYAPHNGAEAARTLRVPQVIGG